MNQSSYKLSSMNTITKVQGQKWDGNKFRNEARKLHEVQGSNLQLTVSSNIKIKKKNCQSGLIFLSSP